MTALAATSIDATAEQRADVVLAALHNVLDQLTVDVGRLVRRCEPGSSLLALASRLADHVEVLAGLLSPAADEIYRELFAACGVEEIAVAEALELVDRRAATLRSRLGRTRP